MVRAGISSSKAAENTGKIIQKKKFGGLKTSLKIYITILLGMAPKSDKEGKGSKKSAPQAPKETPEQPSSKSKKQLDDDDDEVDDDDDAPKASAKSSPKGASKAKKADEEEEEDDDDVEEVDEWEKVEEEEEWDPDFDEFDIPKSKTKKSTGGNTSKKTTKAGDEEDLGLDEEFKDLDLFNESGFDEEEDDF
jgi:DNA-directed RNA polymerase subunit delta